MTQPSAAETALGGYEPGLMDPQAFAGMPNSFSDYVVIHPEVLPDYRLFADAVVERLESTSQGTVIGLWGPHGTGKTRLLTPSIEEAAQQRGFEALGSIGGVKKQGKVFIHLNPSQWLIDKGNSTPEGALTFNPTRENLRRVKETVAETFSSARGPAIYMVDEARHFAFDNSGLLEFIADRARQNSVRLVTIMPVVDPTHANEEISREITAETWGTHVKLGRLMDSIVIPFQIPEQVVSPQAIEDIIATYGITPDMAYAFFENPLLRRLQMVEDLVDLFATRKQVWPEDRRLLAERDIKELHKRQTLNEARSNRIHGSVRDRIRKTLKPRADMSGLTHGAYVIALSELFSTEPKEITK